MHLHLCLTPPPQLAAPRLLLSPLPKPPPSQQPPPPQPASLSPQLFTCSLRPLSYLQVRLRLHAGVGGEAGGAAQPNQAAAGVDEVDASEVDEASEAPVTPDDPVA